MFLLNRTKDHLVQNKISFDEAEKENFLFLRFKTRHFDVKSGHHLHEKGRKSKQNDQKKEMLRKKML